MNARQSNFFDTVLQSMDSSRDGRPPYGCIYYSMKRPAALSRVPVDSAQRFRVEVLFSPGASHNPYAVKPVKQDHTLPVRRRAPLHRGVTTRLLHTANRPLPPQGWYRRHVSLADSVRRCRHWNDLERCSGPVGPAVHPLQTHAHAERLT